MKPALLVALLGLAALPAPRAHAWAELDYQVFQYSPKRFIKLYCEANYSAPCNQIDGASSSYMQPWNPLDGDRWSHYQLHMENQVVSLDMYDLRQGCTVGWGWERGYLWQLYATSPDRMLGPFNICTAHDMSTGKEVLTLKAGFNKTTGLYEFDLRRQGPWQNPGVLFEYDPLTLQVRAIVFN